MSNLQRRRVVITGMGAVTPLGHTVAESWDAVRAGTCGIAPITRYDASERKVTLAAEVKDWDGAALLGRQRAKHLARFTQFALIAAHEAVETSALDTASIDATRAGVIVSSGIGGVEETENQQTSCLKRGFDRCSPFYIPSGISNMAAGEVAIEMGFKGMCTCPVTACAGGSNAVGDAFRHIRDGYAEVMLAGGTEAGHHPALHRRLHHDARAPHGRGPQGRVDSVRRAPLRLCDGRGRRHAAAGGARACARPRCQDHRRGGGLRRHLRRAPHHGAGA